MKKGIVIGLLAVLAMSGCQVKEMGDLAPVREAKVFTATIEDDTFVETKTSLDSDGNVLWKQGDQVSIFAGSTINEQYQVTDASDGKTAASLYQVTITGFVAGTDIDNNVAFYPYAESAAIAKSGNNYIIRDITIPSIQYYAEGSFGNGAFPMTAVTGSPSDYKLKFKNVLGGLKLQLKGTATITSITVTGNSNEILCGAAEVTVANGSVPSLSLTDASAKTVTLDCGNGVQLNTETATSFIIALPAMTMEGGFTVTVTDTEGKQMEIKTTKSQTITRSNLLKMPEVNYEGALVPDSFDVGSDLSVNGTANCYIVTTAGNYSFDVSVMGNGPEGFLWTETIAENRSLWPKSDQKTIIANGDEKPAKALIIWSEGNVIDKNKVTYDPDTKRISFKTTGNEGAALIGLYEKSAQAAYVEDSPAIWSWLIWCTDSPQTMTMYDSEGNQFKLMDRNIGAISADPTDGEATYGYYFQFGRPNPLRAYVGVAADFQNCEVEMKPALSHPSYVFNPGSHTLEWYNTGRGRINNVIADIWGNPRHMDATVGEDPKIDYHPDRAELWELKKTIYDPCPPGYMVPPEGVWERVGTSDDDVYTYELIANGAIVNTENGNSFYPYAGYVQGLQSGEVNNANDLGWFGFYNYQNVLIPEGTNHMCYDYRTTGAVYTSCTGNYSIWEYREGTTINSHMFGGHYLYFSPDGNLRDMTGTVITGIRQRALPVRCMKMPE